jgi:RNA polymerase sigma-70 factor (ECF subfamily)
LRKSNSAPGSSASWTDQRRVIRQRFVEQRSIHEIARQLGRTEGAVKQLQFRALEKLRSQMEGANA